MNCLKSFFIFLILTTYLATSIGVFAQLHYCGGSLASITFVEHGQEKCPCGSKSMKKGCCKDKIVKSKINDAHKGNPLAKFIHIILGEEPNLSAIFFFYSDKKYAFCFDDFKLYEKPPPKPKIPIFLLDRALLI